MILSRCRGRLHNAVHQQRIHQRNRSKNVGRSKQNRTVHPEPRPSTATPWSRRRMSSLVACSEFQARHWVSNTSFLCAARPRRERRVDARFPASRLRRTCCDVSRSAIRGTRTVSICCSTTIFNESTWVAQGRNEVTWRPGQEAKLTSPMFGPEVFRKQMYCIEESTCDIVETFRQPRSHWASPAVIQRLGNCAPLTPPCQAPGVATGLGRKKAENCFEGSVNCDEAFVEHNKRSYQSRLSRKSWKNYRDLFSPDLFLLTRWSQQDIESETPQHTLHGYSSVQHTCQLETNWKRIFVNHGNNVTKVSHQQLPPRFINSDKNQTRHKLRNYTKRVRFFHIQHRPHFYEAET